MTPEETARANLARGAAFPFDASASYWTHAGTAPPARDWAHAAARGVLADLSDRAGFDRLLAKHMIDAETRREIVDALAEVVRLAARSRPEGEPL